MGNERGEEKRNAQRRTSPAITIPFAPKSTAALSKPTSMSWYAYRTVTLGSESTFVMLKWRLPSGVEGSYQKSGSL